MILNNESGEALILQAKFNLTDQQSADAVLILDLYFSGEYDTEYALERLRQGLDFDSEKSVKFLLSGAELCFNRLAPLKKSEVLDLFPLYHVDPVALRKELAETEAGIILPEERIRAGEDEPSFIVNIFKNLFKESLLFFGYNRDLLNDRLIEYLLTEGQVFQEELIKALQANQQLLGTEPITLNSQKVQPTIGNWLADFEANNLISAGDAAKVRYFNDSKNFQNLNEADRNLVARFLEIYKRLKNYQQYLVKSDISAWHIIPPLPNEAELEKKDKITEVKDHYAADLAWLKKKYNLEAGSLKYQDLTVQDLLSALDREPKNPEIVLPVLWVLSKKDSGLQSLNDSSLAFRIKNREFYPGLKGFQDKPLFRQILDIAELAADESALFVMHLAGINKSLMGLAYADLQENSFKWR